MTQGWTSDVFAGTHIAQTDLQNIETNFACLRSTFSGSSAPASPVGYQFWGDSANTLLKIRDSSNASWLSLFNCNTGKIATGAVSSDSLAADAVTSAKIASGAVDTSELADGAVTEDKIEDGAVSEAKLAADLYPDMEAGDFTVHYNDAEQTTTSTTWVKLKESTLGNRCEGELTVELKGKSEYSHLTVYFRVYRNGVAVGSTQSTNSLTYDTFTEDISGWSDGDALQIYGYTSSGAGTPKAYVKELRLKVDDPSRAVVVT